MILCRTSMGGLPADPDLGTDCRFRAAWPWRVGSRRTVRLRPCSAEVPTPAPGLCGLSAAHLPPTSARRVEVVTYFSQRMRAESSMSIGIPVTTADRNASTCRGDVRTWGIIPDGSYRLDDFAELGVGTHHDPAGLASVLGFLSLPAGQAEADPLGEGVRERRPGCPGRCLAGQR